MAKEGYGYANIPSAALDNTPIENNVIYPALFGAVASAKCLGGEGCTTCV